MNDILLKTPPHSLEAERSVLGSMILDPKCAYLIKLNPDDFYRGNHRIIYRTIHKLLERGDSIDIVSVAEALQDEGELENVGDVAYLSDLIENTPTSANVATYARIVKEKARLRIGIAGGHEISGAGYQGDLERMRNAMSDCLITLNGEDAETQWNTKKSATAVLERTDRILNGNEKPGIPFGIPPLDQKYPAGLKPGDFVIIGARPSMGKTSTILNMILNSGVRAAIASLDSTHETLTTRSIAMLAQVAFQKIDTANMADHEWERVNKATLDYTSRVIEIDDRGDMSVGELTQFFMAAKQEHDIQIGIIDYLQLLSAPGTENRTQEISLISRKVKALAKRLHIPIVACSQLNRDLEKRNDKHPIMADLRESGQIEQDAEMVIFLYRDAIYNDVEDTCIEFMVEKCKNGPVSHHYHGWDKELMLFRDHARETYSQWNKEAV